ncbi:MAG TPA: hypothetical protein DCR87_03135 [Acidobacteria bacterium]|nr:hypothetical protein [Acidobacteriota bacterium]
MRGYYGRHYGYGYGQGFGPGYGRGWHQNWRGQVQPPEGFTYLGPCRCGFGPNAYWQERETGHIFRGFPGYRGWFRPGYAGPEQEPADEDLRSELNWLKQEKEELETRIKELEETLKKKYKEEEEK